MKLNKEARLTGMESKCDKRFPSLLSSLTCSSDKILAIVFSSSASCRLLFKLELELALALSNCSDMLTQEDHLLKITNSPAALEIQISIHELEIQAIG